jgi:hypothetical protein
MHSHTSFVPSLFLLKTQYGFRENDPVVDSGPKIVINLPGPLSVQQGQVLDGVVIPPVEGAQETRQIEYVPPPIEERHVHIEGAASAQREHSGVSVPLSPQVARSREEEVKSFMRKNGMDDSINGRMIRG